MLRRTVLGGAALGASAWFAPARAQRSHPHIAALRNFLALPDASIDFGKIKLGIDQMADPTVDVAWAARRLDDMVTMARAMLDQQSRMRPLSATDQVDILRASLYLPGVWNEHKVFKYDLENDPSGKAIFVNNLLPVYLRTQRGNCVSMPILFVVLAQRLGIDATLATAPQHLLVKYRNEAGTYGNLECTHECGPKRDASYIKEFEISDGAVRNRVYLQPLGKRDVILAMSGVLGSMYYRKNDIASLHAHADLLQEYRPDSLEAIQARTAAYGAALNARYRSQFKRFEDIPAGERGGARELLRQIKTLDEKAYALGWRELSPEFEASYQRVVQGARKTQ